MSILEFEVPPTDSTVAIFQDPAGLNLPVIIKIQKLNRFELPTKLYTYQHQTQDVHSGSQ
jgi:hypothetical protein